MIVAAHADRNVPLRPIGRAMMTLIIINPAAPDAGQVV
jgi:hypothetical protein